MTKVIRDKPPRKLTPQQDRFAQEYIIDLNATQAAKRAGYSEISADMLGYQLLQNPIVLQTIQRYKATLSKKTAVTAQNVVNELAKLGFADMGDYSEWSKDGTKIVPSKELREGQTAAVQEINISSLVVAGESEDDEKQVLSQNIKLKLHDKKGALDLLGRHLGLFTERVADPEAPTPVAVNIVVEDGRRPDTDGKSEHPAG